MTTTRLQKQIQIWGGMVLFGVSPLFALDLSLNAKVDLRGNEICLRDFGTLQGNLNEQDQKKWQSVCVMKLSPQQLISQKNGQLVLSRDQIELFLLENNFFVKKIHGSKITFKIEQQFFSEAQLKEFIVEILQYPPDSTIEFSEPMKEKVVLDAKLAVIPLRNTEIGLVEKSHEFTNDFSIEKKVLLVNVNQTPSQFGFSIKTSQRFFRLKGDIRRNEVIQENQVEVISASQVPPHLLKNRVALLKRNPVGKKVGISLAKSHILRTTDIQGPDLTVNSVINKQIPITGGSDSSVSEEKQQIQAGSRLELIFEDSTMEIKIDAKLQKSAKVGEAAIFYTQQGRKIQARILDSQTAIIDTAGQK